MTTTIRIDENIKHQLKLKSAETGVSQLDLANNYILKGLKEDNTPNKECLSIEEIEILFKEEANKDRLNGIVNTKESLSDLAGLVSIPDKTGFEY